MPLMSKERYSAVAVALHWMIASLILFNLITGTFMESLDGEQKHIVLSLHNSSGLTVLGLSLLRIGVRLFYRPPPFDETMSRLERMAAKGVHALFYVLMIAMPLIGWSIISFGRKSTSSLYLLMRMPRITYLTQLPEATRHVQHEQFIVYHTIGAWILFALLLAHVGGALKHQFMDRRPQIARMWF